MIAFYSDRDGNPEIYIMNPDGSDQRRLTYSPFEDSSPDWSRDGSHIAFISDRTGEEEIYLVDQTGQGEWKQLTNGGLGFRMHLEWSPDSKHIMFSDKFMRLNLVEVASGTLIMHSGGSILGPIIVSALMAGAGHRTAALLDARLLPYARRKP